MSGCRDGRVPAIESMLPILVTPHYLSVDRKVILATCDNTSSLQSIHCTATKKCNTKIPNIKKNICMKFFFFPTKLKYHKLENY